MSLVEILVPEPQRELLRFDLREEPDVSVRSSPSGASRVKRLVFVSLEHLHSASGYQQFERLLKAVKQRQFQRSDLTCILGSWTRGSSLSVPIAIDLVLHTRSVCSRTLTAPDVGALRRIVRARRLGAEESLIAWAQVNGRDLTVCNCASQIFRVSLLEMPAFQNLPDESLQNFRVSDSGSRVHWNEADLDLDLDAIRELVDPEYRQRNEKRAREELTQYGRAIRKLRETRGLRQSDIEGVSERQLRRIEEGGVLPHAETLAKLAAAHGMDTSTYLEAVAKTSS